MKKIDKLFKEFPELSIMESWIRKTVASSKFHPVKNVYKRYTQRNPKHFDLAITTLKNPNSEWNKRWWADMYITHFFWGTALFSYLNNNFAILKKIPNHIKLFDKLKNKEQFFDTISEIEFNAYFGKRYRIELEPRINYEQTKYKELDSKIFLSSRPIYVEIMTPKMNRRLLHTSKAIALNNRSKNKILDKLDRQIIPIKDKLRCPLIIVINSSHSEMGETEVEDAILGQSQLTLTINTNTGQTIDIRPSRDSNSVSQARPQSSCISAVLIYKSLIKPGYISCTKSLILNTNADYPLTKKEYKALNRFNLSNI